MPEKLTTYTTYQQPRYIKSLNKREKIHIFAYN